MTWDTGFRDSDQFRVKADLNNKIFEISEPDAISKVEALLTSLLAGINK